MSTTTMSLQARKELLHAVRERYRAASWKERVKLVDGFIAATGYDRKYALRLLNKEESAPKVQQRIRARKYDDEIKQVLVTLWKVANQICSKRLHPFLPELLDVFRKLKISRFLCAEINLLKFSLPQTY